MFSRPLQSRSDAHPPLTEIRLYAIHATKPRASARIESHVAFCEECAAALEKIQQQQQRLRADLRQCGLSSHISPQGHILIWIVGVDACWQIQIIGPGVYVSTGAPDKATAVRTAILEFTKSLPQHSCEDCAPPNYPPGLDNRGSVHAYQGIIA